MCERGWTECQPFLLPFFALNKGEMGVSTEVFGVLTV